MLIFSMLGKTEVAGIFKFTIDRTSRKFSRVLGLIFVVVGLVVVIQPSVSSMLMKSWSSPIRNLHKAAIAWDQQTAFSAIQELRATGDECDQMLANSVDSWLAQYGLDTFNYINVIQISIQEQYPNCKYPLLNHSDQVAAH